MSARKILIINGHPTQNSYCQALAEAYQQGALNAGREAQLLNLHELSFDPNFKWGYSKKQAPVEDIVMAQEKIKWADHVVIVHPVWWGSMPALLKGFFDVAFLPGFAFKYRENSVWWDKLLAGRTARIIYTSDAPNWVYRYFYGEPSVSQIKRRILQFCGFRKVGVTGFGPIRKSSLEFRERALEQVAALGVKGK